ncbi:MAG: NAD-dependent malic enzyme [Candidatus Kapabacteria bacterium]|nr:NAD-dependent malic enzyme [Candidatus Kapabacteria bacterium]
MRTFSLKIDPLTQEEYLEVYLRGKQLLADPFLNKASAFSEEERLSLELEGLVRYALSDLDVQVERSYDSFLQKNTDLEKYIFLQGLLDRNEILFYKTLMLHLKEMLPIVYTPTVGQACMQLSRITRRYRGIYLNITNLRNIDTIFRSISQPEVYLIVVTDGERILGLGDLGSDGMGIPIGKVSLYVAAGGIHPACTLPITLDVGTNNEALLRDPLYLGHKVPRLEGDAYFDFVERFVLGVKRNFPNALLQWEDFAKHKAFDLMQRYGDRILSFNDDIQGTGAISLSAMMAGLSIKNEKFSQQRFAIVGLGQAGAGIAFNIMAILKEEGLSEEESARLIYAIDQPGLLMEDSPNLELQMKRFAHSRSDIADWELENSNKITLKDVVFNAKPTILIGVTAQAGLFNNEILEQMAVNTERPMIFALSNPTSKCECTPSEVYRATKGKGLMAAGSPFDPIVGEYGTMHSSQCNNMYIFPGIGLGALIAKAPRITYKMFLSASKVLSKMVTEEDKGKGILLPDLDEIRKVSFEVAKAVAICARDTGLGRYLEEDELDRIISKAQWNPQYYTYRPGFNTNQSLSGSFLGQ